MRWCLHVLCLCLCRHHSHTTKFGNNFFLPMSFPYMQFTNLISSPKMTKTLWTQFIRYEPCEHKCMWTGTYFVVWLLQAKKSNTRHRPIGIGVQVMWNPFHSAGSTSQPSYNALCSTRGWQMHLSWCVSPSQVTKQRNWTRRSLKRSTMERSL